MGAMASQITSLTIVYSTVYSGADQSKHQISASLAFVWGIHRRPVNFPHKWPVTRKMFSFDDVIMGQELIQSRPSDAYTSKYVRPPSIQRIASRQIIVLRKLSGADAQVQKLSGDMVENIFLPQVKLSVPPVKFSFPEMNSLVAN